VKSRITARIDSGFVHGGSYHPRGDGTQYEAFDALVECVLELADECAGLQARVAQLEALVGVEGLGLEEATGDTDSYLQAQEVKDGTCDR
jgi:hypothetical protein